MQARYTEYLRDIMLSTEGAEALKNALSEYPLYASENDNIADLIPSREALNNKLLNHYKYREIGFETVGRFLDELKITMGEIMPRYNELFKTVEIMANIEDPFGNVDIVENYEETRTDTSSTEGENSATGTNTASGTSNMSSSTENSNTSNNSATTGNTTNSKQVETDTPQSSVEVGTLDIDNVAYASKVAWTENISSDTEERTVTDNGTSETTNTGSNESESSSTTSGSSSSTSESSGTVSHTFTKKGNQGVNTYAHDMNEFRTSIIDVVQQIITDDRIDELFMRVY